MIIVLFWVYLLPLSQLAFKNEHEKSCAFCAGLTFHEKKFKNFLFFLKASVFFIFRIRKECFCATELTMLSLGLLRLILLFVHRHVDIYRYIYVDIYIYIEYDMMWIFFFFWWGIFYAHQHGIKTKFFSTHEFFMMNWDRFSRIISIIESEMMTIMLKSWIRRDSRSECFDTLYI